MQDAKTAGRIVGVLLVFLIIGGVVGNFVLTAPVFAAPGYLVNAAAHPLNLSLSVIVGIAMGAIALGIAITTVTVLRRHGERLALWLLAIAIVNFTLAAVEQIALLSLLSLSNAYNGAVAPDEALFQALRGVVSAARNWAHYVHLVIAGGMLLVFFSALCRFALVPRVLAAIGIVACSLQVVGVAMPIFGLPVAFPLLAPMGATVLATAAWLLVKGFDGQHPTIQAEAT